MPGGRPPRTTVAAAAATATTMTPTTAMLTACIVLVALLPSLSAAQFLTPAPTPACGRTFDFTEQSPEQPMNELQAELLQCDTVIGDVIITNTAFTTLDFMRRVKFLDGDLVITDNTALETLAGLDTLQRVFREIKIINNPQLRTSGAGLMNLLQGGAEMSVFIKDNPRLRWFKYPLQKLFPSDQEIGVLFFENNPLVCCSHRTSLLAKAGASNAPESMGPCRCPIDGDDDNTVLAPDECFVDCEPEHAVSFPILAEPARFSFPEQRGPDFFAAAPNNTAVPPFTESLRLSWTMVQETQLSLDEVHRDIDTRDLPYAYTNTSTNQTEDNPEYDPSDPNSQEPQFHERISNAYLFEVLPAVNDLTMVVQYKAWNAERFVDYPEVQDPEAHRGADPQSLHMPLNSVLVEIVLRNWKWAQTRNSLRLYGRIDHERLRHLSVYKNPADFQPDKSTAIGTLMEFSGRDESDEFVQTSEFLVFAPNSAVVDGEFVENVVSASVEPANCAPATVASGCLVPHTEFFLEFPFFQTSVSYKFRIEVQLPADVIAPTPASSGSDLAIILAVVIPLCLLIVVAIIVAAIHFHNS